MQNLKKRLEKIYKVATGNASIVAARNKKRYDQRVVASALNVGDCVLVRNVCIRGKHKLADKWVPDIYITRKAGDLPVFTVKLKERMDLFRHYKGICCCHVDSCKWTDLKNHLPKKSLGDPEPETVPPKNLRKMKFKVSIQNLTKNQVNPIFLQAHWKLKVELCQMKTLVTSPRNGRTVNLPGVEPVSEQDAGDPLRQEPVNDTILPEPVERNLLYLPEVEAVVEDLVDGSEREIERKYEAESTDNNKSADNPN